MIYEHTWESLDSHQMPEWYEDAKIGLSMHWGVYSVPGWVSRGILNGHGMKAAV
jgi:alpha-L-fucosidase